MNDLFALTWTLGIRLHELSLTIDLHPGSTVLRIDANNGFDSSELELVKSTAHRHWMVASDSFAAELAPCFSDELADIADTVTATIGDRLYPRIASIAHSALWYVTEVYPAAMNAALDSIIKRRQHHKRQIDWVDRSYEDESAFVHTEIDCLRREHPDWSMDSIVESLIRDVVRWEDHARWEAEGIAPGSWFGGQREWTSEEENDIAENDLCHAWEASFVDYRPFYGLCDEEDEKVDDSWEGWNDESIQRYTASFRTYDGPESRSGSWWEEENFDDDPDYLEAAAEWDDEIENARYVDE